MNYAFVHEGKAFGPDGPIKDQDGTLLPAEDATTYNKELERQELAWLQTGPDRVFLYVRIELGAPSICTWLGTVVGTNMVLGPRWVMGFQSCLRSGSYRRALSCRIFGVLYHGWYYESSGEYCRLKRTKRQQGL